MEKAGAWVYKLRDCPNWGVESEKRRFTPSNLADFVVFFYDTLFIVECKSVKGKSIRWDAVNPKHLAALVKASGHDGIQPGILVEFRETAEIFWIHAGAWERMMLESKKKSFTNEQAALFADDVINDDNADWHEWLVFWLRDPERYRREG